jgi:hypothetical protein
VIHNFMDACRLERDRVNACSFMAITQRGPISMCVHNAKRDSFILAPIRLNGPDGENVWHPLSGEATENSMVMDRSRKLDSETAKGRVRRALMKAASVGR